MRPGLLPIDSGMLPKEGIKPEADTAAKAPAELCINLLRVIALAFFFIFSGL
jgi:hypothetical protein